MVHAPPPRLRVDLDASLEAPWPPRFADLDQDDGGIPVVSQTQHDRTDLYGPAVRRARSVALEQDLDATRTDFRPVAPDGNGGGVCELNRGRIADAEKVSHGRRKVEGTVQETDVSPVMPPGKGVASSRGTRLARSTRSGRP